VVVDGSVKAHDVGQAIMRNYPAAEICRLGASLHWITGIQPITRIGHNHIANSDDGTGRRQFFSILQPGEGKIYRGDERYLQIEPREAAGPDWPMVGNERGAPCENGAGRQSKRGEIDRGR
jgi:hypothetical protein